MNAPQKQLVWLVTGTSSGFGREMVLAALARGEKVIATTRPESFDRLRELREKGAALLELDASWPLEKLKEVVNKAEGIYGRIDVLFNNAGRGQIRALEEETPEETQDLFALNVFGGLNLARAVLPGMRARREGTILWNGSMLGWDPVPGIGAYCASKFCVRGLSLVLDKEISPFGLRSIVVEPGHFRTDIIKKSNEYEARIPDYSPMTQYVFQSLKTLSGNQPGDTMRGVEVIVDLVRGEGGAKGREVPKALSIGSDSFGSVESICKAELQKLNDWKEVIISTDIPGEPENL